jgi:hypothetical protein
MQPDAQLGQTMGAGYGIGHRRTANHQARG